MKITATIFESSYPLTKLSLYESDCMIAQFGFSEENCFQLLLVGVQEVKK